MVKSTTIVVSLIVSLGALPVHADTANKEVLTRTLLKMSGLKQQIRQIPPKVLSELAKQQGKMPPELYKTIVPVFQDAYSAESLERRVSKHVESNLDIETMRKALVWLQSGLGKKVAHLEETRSSPQGAQQMRVFTEQEQVNRPGVKRPAQRRLALAQRLDAATGSTELSVSIAESTASGVATALDAIRPKCRQAGADRIQKLMEHQRPHRKQVHRQMTTVSFLDVYQTLSDAEIERFLDFLESKVGRTYQKGLGEALKAALVEAAQNAERASPAAMTQSLNGGGDLVNQCERMIQAAASSPSSSAATQLAYCTPW